MEGISYTFKPDSNKLEILRLLLSISETSGPYNLLSLPLIRTHNISICTYFKTNVKVPREIKIFEGDDSLFGFFRGLKSALSKKQYDIIHAHTPHVAFLFLIAKLLFKKKQKFRTVTTLHCSYNNLKLRNKLLLFFVFPFFKRVVACSKSSLESVPWFFKKLVGKRIRVVPNGVDIARIDKVINRVPRQNENVFRIICIGRLISMKNPITLIHAFKKILDGKSELIFIGEGNLKNEILRECELLGLKNYVTLTGEIPRDKVYEYLANSKLFVSLSLREGLPISVLEAMASYCPVILSNIPAHREIAGDSNFIPLINPRDEDKLVQEIKNFRQISINSREKIGEKCRELVEKNFSLAKMISGYERIYAELSALENK